MLNLKLHPETNETIVIISSDEISDVCVRPFGDGLEHYNPIEGERIPKYVDGWHILEPDFWNDEFGGICSFQALVDAVKLTIAIPGEYQIGD